MSIFVDENTKVIVQGLTGGQGRFHGLRNRDYGTKVVGGVTPGKGGTDVDGVPVFDSVKEAVAATGATASFVVVPPKFAPAAILEAAEGGITFIVCITEGIPAHDEAVTYNRLVEDFPGVRLLGPNCPGIISPGKCNIGITSGDIALAGGPVGIVSRSGTLTYQALHELSTQGIGQTTCVGIGGDPVPGTNFIDCLAAFEADPETKAVMMIGEIGGSEEERAARTKDGTRGGDHLRLQGDRPGEDGRTGRGGRARLSEPHRGGREDDRHRPGDVTLGSDSSLRAGLGLRHHSRCHAGRGTRDLLGRLRPSVPRTGGGE